MNKDLPIRAAPFAHQCAAYAAALDEMVGEPRRILDADGKVIREKGRAYAFLCEMGCGKSLMAVATAGTLSLSERIRRILVVAPLSVTGVWEEEFSKFAAFDYVLAVLKGSGKKKLDTLRHLSGPKLQVAVANYEFVRDYESAVGDWVKGVKIGGTKRGGFAGGGAYGAVGEGGQTLIIADEAHRIKTHDSATSMAMHRLGRIAGYKILLTGTPVTNSAKDIFSQYKFANSSIFGENFFGFARMYFDKTGFQGHELVLKKSKEDELSSKIALISYRATKAECLDLPETTDVMHYVELEDKAAKLYKNLVRDSYSELGASEISATNVLTRLLRLCQVTGGFIGSDDDPRPQCVSRAKLNALQDIVESVCGEGKKIVIIAHFTPEIEAIKAKLKELKIKFAVVAGATKDRAEQVSMFQNDADCMAFVGQIQVAGLGITLIAASTLVFYSYDYSFSNFEQTKARIHRAGQKQSCTYLYLVARGTVDEKILAALNEKRELAKALIDDYRRGVNPFA